MLRLVPVVLSLLVLGAHFLRAGNLPFVVLVLTVLALLAVRRPWAARAVQVALVLGALEWTSTLIVLAGERLGLGEPVLRLAIILGGVAILTALSGLVFRTERLRRAYGLGRGRG